MKISLRLGLSFSIMLVLIIVLIGVGIDSLSKIDQNMDEIVNVENVRTQLANIMATDFRDVSIALQTIIVDKNKTSLEEQKIQISNSRKSYDESFIKYEALVTKDETKILDQILKVKGFAEETRAENNIVIALVAEGKYDAALGEFIKNEKPELRALIENINVLVILENKNTLGHYQNAQNVYANVRFMMFLFGGIALVIAATIALLLTRSITKPLKLATNLVLTRDTSLDLSEYEKGSGELGLMIQSFSKDILERMRLELEMKKAAGYARNLIEASLDPLVTISAEGKITDVNAATIKVTGVSREQLIGSDFADYFTEPEKARTGYKQVFSQGVVIDYPLTMRNSSGQTMEVLYNASVYKNEAGEVQGVFAAARDITASKRQEKELIEYRDQLEETVKQRTADLTKIIIEVRETVNVLASASSEILAATTQVASGTAETATAINETSTTVEEVQQASKQSSQKAQNVADSAQKVVQVFQNGKKAVEETTAGISNIKEQMDSIAQTVVRLSEQSQSIGGIIASVTDIADQSNLLAVNAAIEAAKAGEQGKGFAVVAQEIKNLASQSKQATLKVRNILNDVQKATGAAVMATEQGSKAVESGIKQSILAGEAIRILAESSNEAVQAATQIVASSQQQVVGMDQIGIAMQNINQAGTETAVSMVQAERSARSLYELGQKLKDLIGDFKE
jgi:PAS domain S-box-containing protein